MDETRGFPRFLPRPGASISVTVGSSLTPLVSDMVQAYRASRAELDQAAPLHPSVKEVPGPQSIANTGQEGKAYGDWPYAEREDMLTRDTRVAITNRLQEELTRLGERVEAAEGRFDRGDWAQSRPNVERAMEKSIEIIKP